MNDHSSKRSALVPDGTSGHATSEALGEDLAARLEYAEEMIRAIHSGEVDALVVGGADGPRVYTLEGADHPYRVLVERMQEGTLTIDLNGVVLYSNPQFASMMSAPLESVAGSCFETFVTPASRIDFAELMEAAMSAGHRSAELALADSEGNTIPVRASMSRLDLSGVAAMSILVTDLREQRRHESMAREEQLSRLILEQAGEAIVVIDPEGRILRRSESAKLIAGRAVWATHFDETFPLRVSGTACDVDWIFAAIRRGESIRALEASMPVPGGACLSLLVSASPLWDDGEGLLGCVITLIDITDRKHAEAELARQAQELARSNSDLRQFAYSASHDLREPVRQIAVFSELLGEKFQQQVDEQGAYLIRQTVNAAHRIEKLLRDLLAYMQAAEAPQPPASGVDANAVVHRVLTTFQPKLEESGASRGMRATAAAGDPRGAPDGADPESDRKRAEIS